MRPRGIRDRLELRMGSVWGLSRRADEGGGGGTWHVARETDPVVDAGRWLA
eukprot:CAMPEP_0182564844 /NCGR_PEP_ID=MMETSP1324-20130603/6704_1 /TAXON_ID=236786 /ORGANISM="Florenciella sp., Strain RCC1587" /LENGTH=50 /DNA_ID=CAMNT_0024778387 /DNA_START=78 /DNA_END=227 /DNA_ORIENTATION=-